jgi:hypothetical protein
MNPGIRIHPLLSVIGVIGRRMSWFRSGKLVVLRMRNYPRRRLKYKLANDMKMWNGKGKTTTLLFSLRGFEILHQERIGQVNITVMEHFNSILFHKSGPANRQHTYQSIHYTKNGKRKGKLLLKNEEISEGKAHKHTKSNFIYFDNHRCLS